MQESNGTNDHAAGIDGGSNAVDHRQPIPDRSPHVHDEEAMKLDPFITVPLRCDDVQAVDASNAFGNPGAALKVAEETGNQFQDLQVLLSHRSFRTPEELHGALSSRSEPSCTQPRASVASRSGSSVPIFFATFIDAMHESRRCQAAREIRQYQNIAEEARAYELRRARTLGHSGVPARRLSAASKRLGPDRPCSSLLILWKWLLMWMLPADPRPHGPHSHYKAREG
jgi:hypothetical protein